MTKSIRSLDRILRGESTQLADLQRGEFDVPVAGLSLVITILGGLYGACMGLPAVLIRFGSPTAYMGGEQVLASMFKVPLLFLLTLIITFPSLYVFNALMGSRLTLSPLLRLLIASLTVIIALLASFGPIVAFFAVSTTSYPFMKLLNVIVFSIAGFLGMAFLLRTLQRLTIVQNVLASRAGMSTHPPLPPMPPASASSGPAGSTIPLEPMDDLAATAAFAGAGAPGGLPPAIPPAAPGAGALDRVPRPESSPHVVAVFRIWLIVFGLVGAQMGWVLRPFIGNPDQPFSLLRPRGSNFFEALLHTLGRLFAIAGPLHGG